MAVYKVNEDGKAPTGLKVGDEVVTGGGTVKITGVNADGTYQSAVSNKTQTTKNYTGGYAGASNTASGNSQYAGVRQPAVNTATNFAGNGASGIYKAPEDYQGDNVDYAAKMLASMSNAEFQEWAKQRDQKAAAQGIALGSPGYASNDELYDQWLASDIGSQANRNDHQAYAYMSSNGLLKGGGSPVLKQGSDGSVYAIASDGKPVKMTDRAGGTLLPSTMPNPTRDTSRAGQTIKVGEWTISYNEDGYVKSTRKTGYDGMEKYREYNYNTMDVNTLDDVLGMLDGFTPVQLPNSSASQQPQNAVSGGYYGDFSYGAAPEYNDAYSSTIDAMLEQLLNRDAFSYNAANDPMYQQYAEMYQREGDRAMRNTMGEASARTGGLASSYATTAAQQANQYYNQQLADKIPELQQLAYQMYLDDINLQVQDLGLLQNASETAYNRYRDTMADWYNDRDFAYGAYRDDVADNQWQTQFDYNAERDSIADQQWREQFDYNANRDSIADSRYEQEWAYQVAQDQRAAASRAASGGGGTEYGDEVTAVAAFLGISEKEANALKNTGSTMYSQALSELGIGSNGGGGGGGDVSVDMQSVLALGYGPISASRLDELEQSGEITSYVENGKIKFRRNSSSNNSGGGGLLQRPY